MELASKILSDVTVYMKYAKWIEAEQRKESWDEVVDRNMNMHLKKLDSLGYTPDSDEYQKVVEVYNEYVRPFKVLPSMRSMQYAGKPIEVAPNSIYNCAYMPVDSVECFHEAMFLLLSLIHI